MHIIHFYSPLASSSAAVAEDINQLQRYFSSVTFNQDSHGWLDRRRRTDGWSWIKRIFIRPDIYPFSIHFPIFTQFMGHTLSATQLLQSDGFGLWFNHWCWLWSWTRMPKLINIVDAYWRVLSSFYWLWIVYCVYSFSPEGRMVLCWWLRWWWWLMHEI